MMFKDPNMTIAGDGVAALQPMLHNYCVTPDENLVVTIDADSSYDELPVGYTALITVNATAEQLNNVEVTCFGGGRRVFFKIVDDNGNNMLLLIFQKLSESAYLADNGDTIVVEPFRLYGLKSL